MKRTTVKLPDYLDARLRHEAERRGTTVSELTREAIEAHLGGRRGRRRLLAASAGASGRSEVRFLGDIAAGDLILEAVAASYWLRMAELVATYRHLPLGAVDASVVTAAERLTVSEVATLDRRDFTVVGSAIGRFELRP